MKNTYRIIPTYTGDVSGACSALYELGGMVVMHDPSGCNSTYNTHDESRWYDRESLIYISGLNELDAILGNDQKFIDDIIYAAEEMKPKFIALVSAPIPYLNGTDFEGIARLIEKKTGLMTFFVPTNGMHDYTLGVGNAWLKLGQRILKEPSEKRTPGKGPIAINLLGLTPLDYDGEGILACLKEKLSDFEILTSWAMEEKSESPEGLVGPEDLARASEAQVNLVLSVTGLPLAEWMWETLGIPYVQGAPVGDYTGQLKEEIRWAAEHQTLPEKGPVGTGPEPLNPEIMLIGEPILMYSLARHLGQKVRPCVLNPTETECSLADVRTYGEEDLEERIKDAGVVIADPLYRPIVPENAKFVEVSHLAFSGRCFPDKRVNLLGDFELCL